MDLIDVGSILPAERSSPDRWRPGDAWLAGGTWLFSEPQPGLSRLFDLTACAWPSLATGDQGLEIAATCTLADLARWPGRPEWPASELARRCCEALLGSFKVCNSATVGGNLCLALPAGPMISLATALDGTCTIWGPAGESREVRALDFVLAPRRTVLEPGELLRSITLPAGALRAQPAFRRYSLSPVGRSAVLVIGRRGLGGDEVVITITASVRRPVQLRFAAFPNPDDLAAAIAGSELEYHDDVHGDPKWRAHLTRLLAEEVRAELEGTP
jgi:CO/xanthine dehydrogenase FAD-binding subunit